MRRMYSENQIRSIVESQDLSIDGKLTVKRDMVAESDLDVDGDIGTSGNVSCENLNAYGNVSVPYGNVSVAGNITATGNVTGANLPNVACVELESPITLTIAANTGSDSAPVVKTGFRDNLEDPGLGLRDQYFAFAIDGGWSGSFVGVTQCVMTKISQDAWRLYIYAVGYTVGSGCTISVNKLYFCKD